MIFLKALFILSVVFAYSVDFEDLPIFLEEEEEDVEVSRPEFIDFMEKFGK